MKRKIIILVMILCWCLISSMAIAIDKKDIEKKYTEEQYNELKDMNEIIQDKYNNIKKDYDDLVKEKQHMEARLSNMSTNVSVIEEKDRILNEQYSQTLKEKETILNQSLIAAVACFITGFLISLAYFMNKLKKMPRILDDEFADEIDGYSNAAKIIDKEINKGGMLSMNFEKVKDKLYNMSRRMNGNFKEKTEPVLKKRIVTKKENVMPVYILNDISQKKEEKSSNKEAILDDFTIDEKTAEQLDINKLTKELEKTSKRIKDLEE